jgi:mannose/fructose/sorbose-specific phosphotransferase system IIB component
MDIQLVRIDDRLIHGQVVVGWVKALDIQCLVVVNDAIAANPTRRSLMELAVPQGLQVRFETLQGAAGIPPATADAPRALLLFEGPQDVLECLRRGAKFPSVNVGGLHYCEGKRQVDRSLCVNDGDVEAFRELKRLGVDLEVRAVPGDPREPLEKCLPELKNG